MTLAAKICGINSATAMDAAVAGGAAFVGLNFYPPSPRAVSPDQAADLATRVPETVQTVGLFVDPDDRTVEQATARARLDLLQLHGNETPERVKALRETFERPVMKAFRVRSAADLAQARAYEGFADWLLFDAKPPKDMAGALPGGNALSFDWSLLAGTTWELPWMLAGGLEASNVAAAVRTSGARWVDVSSGVEDRPGQKSAAKIAAFLAVIKRFERI